MSVLSPSRTRRDPRRIANRGQKNDYPSLTPPSRMGRVFNERCRQAVFRWLSRIKIGRLRLVEPGRKRCFGKEGEGGPNVTLRVRDERFYRSLVLGGTIGAGEAFFLGYWTTEDLVGVLRFFCQNATVTNRFQQGMARFSKPMYRLIHRMRPNTIVGALRNMAAHYDLGNEFYSCFLDKTMCYSSGMFLSETSSLAEASVEKLDRICRKLRLRKTDRVIDVGCGWGGFAVHAATNYGCQVTGITISEEQYEHATRLVAEKCLGERITILLKDYRHVRGKFDKLVSVEMIENVGREFLDTFFKTCSDLLKPTGAMLLQAIRIPDQRYDQYVHSADFIQQYIFPGGFLPSLGAICRSTGSVTDLQPIHLEDMTVDYADTLMHWRLRFLDRVNDVREMGYSEEFLRLWEYYLAYCEAGFREKLLADAQILFAKPRCNRKALLA